ncbi:MAG: transglutaminase domain-containing protein [Dehalococcoidales bacterium]
MKDNLRKPAARPDRLKKALTPEAPPAPVPREGNWRTWLNIALLFLTLEVAVFSVERAQWLTPQPAFTLVLFLAMLFVWLLVFARAAGWLIHILAPVVGVLVAVWQALNCLPGAHSFHHLFTVLKSWWQPSAALLPGEENVVFALVIALLVWLIGYLGIWFLLRRHNAWVAVTLGAVVIIVNLSNLSAVNYYYFPAFFVAAVLLVIQTRIAGQFVKSGRGSGYTAKSLLYLVVPLVCIVVLASSLAWLTPQARASGLQNLMSSALGWKQDMRESRLNIFNAVPAKQAFSTSSLLTELTFEKGWNQGNIIHFIVHSNRPSYWPMDIYDTYTSTGWVNSPTTGQPLDAKVPRENTASVSQEDLMRYEVTMNISGDVVLVAGNLVSSDSPVVLHEAAGNEVMEVTTQRILGIGESYSVQSVLVNPTADQLSGAGDDYPGYIRDYYLQLPPDYSEAVRLLSENITAGAATPYAKVLAVVDYLAGFPYEAIIDAPPEGTDGVSYFLFTEKRGFCLYFASAMAVMLRTIDVPARLVVGYLPGEPGDERGTYILRDWHYHAWAQVYFPGYGWVNFEATPGGGGGSGSQISVETPLVSIPAIRELPQWNAWNYLAPPPENIPAPPPPAAPAQAESRHSWGVLPFADELGRALAVIVLVIIGAAVVIALLLLSRRAFFRRLWYVERRSLAYHTYAKLCRLAAMAGIYPRPQQTPLEFAAALQQALPEEADAIDGLVRAYQENRYGRREGKPGLYEEALLLKSRHLVYDKLLRLTGKRSWRFKLFSPGAE